MKKLSTILLAVLISVLCVLSTGAAEDLIFWDFSDEAVVAQWVGSDNTTVKVTTAGAKISGTNNNVNLTYTPTTDIILDNYQYVVFEYAGASINGGMQLYHWRGGSSDVNYLQGGVTAGDAGTVRRQIFDIAAGAPGVVNWTGKLDTFRLDPCRAGVDVEITVKYLALFANKAQYDALGAYIASDFGVYCNDTISGETMVLPVGGDVKFVLKAPAKHVIGGDCQVTWNKYTDDIAHAMPVADGMVFTVDTAEAGEAYYYATVNYEGGSYQSAPVKVIVCDEATYEEYNKYVDTAYTLYRGDAVAASSEEILVGKPATFMLKGPADYIFNGYNVEWFRDGVSAGKGKTIVVDPETPNSDYVVYKAVVTDAEGNEVYVSNEIRVFACEEINPPVVYYAGDLYNLLAADETSTTQLVNDGTALELTVANGDPHATIKGMNVDLTVYKYYAFKYKITSGGANSMAPFHFFTGNGVNNPGANGSYYDSLSISSAPNFQVTSKQIDLVTEEPRATVYTGMRLDFFNGGSFTIGDKMELEYIGFFTDAAQMNEFIQAGEQVIVPEPEGKFWQFADDADFTSELFANATYVDGVGAKLGAGTTYLANIKTRDKFDLDKYAVVKIFYTAAEDANLTVYNDGSIALNETLPAASGEATFDFRTLWNGEFGKLEFVSDKEITIGAIGFFTNEKAAELYDGSAEIPTAGGALEYEGAIWWNFADMSIFYKLQAINLDKKFNEIENAPNTITLTAQNDGAAKFSYSKIHMYGGATINAAEKYPYITIGYDSAALAGKPAYIKFKSELYPDPVTVNFTWPAALDDNYNGCLMNVGTDNNGYTKLFINFASLANLQAIDPSALSEWRGSIEYVEIGVDNLTAGDEVEIAYINFFEFATHAQSFDGKIILDPESLVTAKWSTKSRVIAEYVTVDDLDLEAEEIKFSVADYSRISRFTLTELKKNYPSKKVIVDGDVYDLEFYPKNVSDDMLTWYYDLEVSFDGTNSGDVYRETVKNLITENEGEYITGVYFLQKFVNDRAMPFKGKLVYEIGEAFNDKYLDIYKYDYREGTVALVERAPVKDGKITITTLGGDLAIVDSGYQPSEEELKRAEAIDVYENTPWNALIFDFGESSGAGLTVKANNAEIKDLTKSGVTYKSIISTKEGQRIELKLQPVSQFEASDYPVVIVKYKTSVNLSGSVNNYVTTDYYAGGTGYEWFSNATYYAATGAYTIAPTWTAKMIDYTNGDTMKASGLAINGTYTEGKTSNGSVDYPFKGMLSEYRLDFNVGPVGTTIDIAYVAFFKTADEAKQYLEARNVIEGFAAEEAKAEEEKANANKPEFYVFDLTDEKEAAKYTFASASESQPTKTESKMTKEGLWMKDDDAEFNITRLLGESDQFELSEYPVLKIKVKYSIPGVTSQLYVWNTAQTDINPRCELLVDKGGEWTEQIWDYSKENMALGTWNGVLTKFRLDPMRGAGRVEREATVAYIGFFKTVEAAEAFDGKIEKK